MLYYIIGLFLVAGFLLMNPMGLTETIVFIVFLFIIGLVSFKYYYNIDITTYLKGLFTSNPVVKVIATQHPDQDLDGPFESKENDPEMSSGRKQVFHVPGQYDYMEAKAVCRAYGGELANMSQMMDAYNKGGEWCDYGWAEDAMALYPTQYATWKKLKEEGKEGACGVPGVNGGYVQGTYSLGANCYANKPNKINMSNPMQSIPQSVEDVELNDRASYWKKRLPRIKIDPFNYTDWSM